MSIPQLKTHALVKSFKRRKVVDRVSVAVHEGEVVGLLGPNGAGKTTTFRMITGLLHPDEGKVIIKGKDVTHLPFYLRARMGLGYLPQESSAFRGLSVEKNISSVLECINVRGGERELKTLELLKEFGLAHVRSSKAQTLSGGERRRLEIARALVTKPVVILLDEPLTGIDPRTVSDVKELIKKLRSKGIGMLITDHNVYDTLSICDRAYIIDGGMILEEGTPNAIVQSRKAQRAYLGDGFSLRREWG